MGQLTQVRKSHGVGRHLTRDQNSSPGSTVVRTPTLREINGKFAGQGAGVKVFHPTGRKKGSVHSPGVFRAVKKSDDERKGMLDPVELINMQAHTGARIGRRIPGQSVMVEKAAAGARFGGVLERMAAKHPQGSKAHTQLSIAGASRPGGMVEASHATDGIRTTLGSVKQGRNAEYAARRLERSRTGRYGRANPFSTPRGLAEAYGRKQPGRVLP